MKLMDDDWYRATVPSRGFTMAAMPGLKPTWRPDISASPMGCVEQFQWCNLAYPRGRGCGPLASWDDSLYGAAPFFSVTNETLEMDRPLPSDSTSARFIWPWMIMDGNSMRLPDLLGILGISSVASQSKFWSGLQSPLPQNQWQLDVLQWWEIMLAAIQASRSVLS